MRSREPSRRDVLAVGAGLGLAALSAIAVPMAAGADTPHLRAIPASGETVPAIGMGTWITFNVGADSSLRAHRAQVLQAFLDSGGRLVDSSPMYGSSEAVVGWCLQRVRGAERVFSATKVWTLLQAMGPGQMRDSRALWGLRRFDLMQVHNLLNWDGHLETLRDDRAAGRLRYLGVTTSHGRRHDELERVMREEPLDFVQLTYNVLDREAEARLLPLAADRGQAVLVNRPFRRGALFQRFGHRPLPGWAAEIGCTAWSQVFLKFVVSHPAVTCAIPATSRVDHMSENMAALGGPLPDPALRRRIVADLGAL